MQKKRLGCFSFTGILAGVLTLLALSGLGLAQGGVMFSPGDLNAQAGEQTLGGVQSHAETGGHCAACHSAAWQKQSMAERCLDCHTELTSDPQNFHAVMLAQSQNAGCNGCHTDHRGKNASLTSLDLRDFPHLAVGYSLQAHQNTAQGSGFACSDCHGSDLSQFIVTVCTDCHAQIDAAYTQVHTQTFGTECLACHDGVDRYGGDFDHNLLPFQLAGKHAATACAGCHAGAHTVGDLQAARQDCFGCHAKDDAHQGQFGQDCASCHTPENWQDATFDHSLAAFALSGAHVDVACESCHINSVFKGTPHECAACHIQDDVHQGQFGQDCAGCHTPEDWKQASFDHSLAAFALTGAHINVECTRCHTDNVFKGTPQECGACHADPDFHSGLFPADCAACHTTATWLPAQFQEAHTFPIDHGEAGPSTCRTCHAERLSAYTCYGCHEHTPAEIEAEHREEGIADFSDCMRCHPTGQEEEGGD